MKNLFDKNKLIIKTSKDKVAGKSPSSVMKDVDTDITYQVKKSNSSVISRNIMGMNTNSSDIIGEYIASQLGDALLNNPSLTTNVTVNNAIETRPLELSPKVEIFFDEKDNSIKIASKYMNDFGKGISSNVLSMSLDDLVTKRSNGLKGHANVYTKSPQDPAKKDIKGLYLGEKNEIKSGDKAVDITISKQDMFRGIQLFIAMQDHDLNPGNMFVVHDKNEKKSYVGRIDYGHAWNDLIKSWGKGKDFSPKIENKSNYTEDFLNRNQINDTKLGITSKFKKHYHGILEDPEFAEFLQNNASQDKEIITKTMNKIGGNLKELYNSNSISKSAKQDIVSSMKTLAAQVGSKDSFDKDVKAYRASLSKELKSANAAIELLKDEKNIQKDLNMDAKLNKMSGSAIYPQLKESTGAGKLDFNSLERKINESISSIENNILRKKASEDFIKFSKSILNSNGVKTLESELKNIANTDIANKAKQENLVDMFIINKASDLISQASCNAIDSMKEAGMNLAKQHQKEKAAEENLAPEVPPIPSQEVLQSALQEAESTQEANVMKSTLEAPTPLPSPEALEMAFRDLLEPAPEISERIQSALQDLLEPKISQKEQMQGLLNAEGVKLNIHSATPQQQDKKSPPKPLPKPPQTQIQKAAAENLAPEISERIQSALQDLLEPEAIPTRSHSSAKKGKYQDMIEKERSEADKSHSNHRS